MIISWDLLEFFEEKFGDSFYLLDHHQFEVNYHQFLQAFRNIYSNTNIAYSYKTNYTPKLCQSVNLWGGYAEVVSRMEYTLARKIGVPPERIIFNGPYKPKPDLEQALLSGSIINIDSPYEVDIVKSIAQDNIRTFFEVGIRVNFDVGTESVSRFGFDVDSDDFEDAVQTLNGLNNCALIGLHCHFLPPERSVHAYKSIAGKMLTLASKCFQGVPPKFIDLGGGFFSKMKPELRMQFDFHIPSFQEYADAIAPAFRSSFNNGDSPELILEPGLALTADTIQYVCKVLDIKTVRGRTVALTSGSIYNIKPTKSTRNLPLQIYNQKGGIPTDSAQREIDIVGYTCMEDDCLYHDYQGSISIGDYLVFDNVGAYTLVLKPPFILPCPPVISYDPSSETIEIIKNQEEFSDIFATYALL